MKVEMVDPEQLFDAAWVQNISAAEQCNPEFWKKMVPVVRVSEIKLWLEAFPITSAYERAMKERLLASLKEQP